MEVPQRPGQLPDHEALLKGLSAVYRGSGGAGTIRQHLAFLRKEGAHAEAEAYRETFFARMWDVSAFMKLLKRFTQWFKRTHGRKGTRNFVNEVFAARREHYTLVTKLRTS